MTVVGLYGRRVSRKIAGIAVAAAVAVLMMGLVASNPVAAGEGTWDWRTIASSEYARPSYGSGISDDGAVIVMVVTISMMEQEVRVSHDGGATWSSVPLLAGSGRIVQSVSVSPDGQKVGLLYSDGTLALSTDSGLHFNPTSAVDSDGNLLILQFFINSASEMLVTAYDNSTLDLGIYYSVDGGATWSRRSVLSVGGSNGIAAASGDLKYIAVTTADGIMLSRDGGITWPTVVPLTSIYTGSSGLYLSGIAISDNGRDITVSPQTNDTIQSSVHVSHDGGATWKTYSGKIQIAGAGTRYISGDGQTILAIDVSAFDFSQGQPRLVFTISRDGGVTWDSLDGYVSIPGDNSTSIPTLSGDGLTISYADMEGEGRTLRFITGRWTPVDVEDDDDDSAGNEERTDVPRAPDSGVYSDGQGAVVGVVALILPGVTALYLRRALR